MSLALSVLACVVLSLLWRLVRRYVLPSPLDNIPGPPRTSLISGNLNEFFNRDGWGFQDHLAATYGPVVKLHGLLGARLLYVCDPAALHRMFYRDQHVYEEPGRFLASNTIIFGPCLVATTGEQHRRQRKMLTPVFSVSHMRLLTPVFHEVVHRLRGALEQQVGDAPKEVNMLSWLNRTTLELIGQAGMGYSFDSLTEEKPNAYGDALKGLLPRMSKLSVLRLLVEHFDKLGSARFRRRIAEMIPHEDFRQLIAITDTMDEYSRAIFAQKLDTLRHGDEKALRDLGDQANILDIMLKANLQATDEDKLPDEELLAQLSILALAGTDTTASALARVLHLLACHPRVQERLRQEVRDARQGHDLPYDELTALPYLDAVCRETLRMYPPAATAFQEPRHDAVLPLSAPLRGVDGAAVCAVPVPRGTTVVVGLRGANRSRAVWGDDADAWVPERWLAPLPAAVGAARVPGVYAHLMTFFAGPRSCIGFKMAEAEMKVLLSVIVERFRFSASNKNIVWNLAYVAYPTIGKDSMQASLPVIVEHLRA